MGHNWLFFIKSDGSSSGILHMDPLLPQSFGGHWLSHITSFVNNSRHLYVPRNLVLREALNCMSKFAGAPVLWFACGSNSNINQKLPGDHLSPHSSCSNISTQVKGISSARCSLTGFFFKAKRRRKYTIPLVEKISSYALSQIGKEIEWLRSFPALSLAGALVPPFTNISSSILAVPLETSSLEAKKSIDQRPCEIGSRGCGHCTDHYLQNLAWSETVEPRTGIKFPSLLDNTISGESSSSFTPEVLVGTGSTIMTIIRIKSLKVYAFGLYVHPFDVCTKLGPKYACIQEDELKRHQDFYRDLLREDINMTVRLVVSCNGIKVNSVKDALEKSLRARLIRTNPDADISCLQTFGSIFSQDIPLHMGTTINFRRTADGHLITEVGGNNLGSVQSRDLCRAFFDMYIGDAPICEQTKEAIGKNVANIIRTC